MATQSAYNKQADKGFDPTKWMSGMQKSARKNAKKKSKSKKYPWLAEGSTPPSSKYFIAANDAAGSPYDWSSRPMNYVNADQYAYPVRPPGSGATLTPIAAAVKPRSDIPSVPWTPGVTPSAGGGTFNEAPGEVPMDEWTGWAARSGFDADMLPYLYDDPSLISRQWLKEQGFSPESGRMASMGDIANLLEMWQMATQGTGGVNTGNPDDFLNFADMVFGGMMDPGGKGVPDFNQMIANILDAPEGSALRAMMETGEFGSEADVFNTLIRSAAALKTPAMQRAIENMLRTKTDEWMLANTRGRKDANGIADWFQKGGGGFFG